MKKFVQKIKRTKNLKEKILISILLKILLILLFPVALNRFETFNENQSQPQLSIPQPQAERFIVNFGNLSTIQTLDQIKAYIFYVDETAYVFEEDFPLQTLSEKDLRINLRGGVPRVLITHTHSQEYFYDSEQGNPDHSIVGVGRYLANIFANKYGVSVVHDIGVYDVRDGMLERSGSYEIAEKGVRSILEHHPSIEVIIDLHRDAAPEGVRFVTEIEGRQTAQIMFFNGITRRNINGTPQNLDELFNPYIAENLALSLQLFLTANENYPNFARRNYIKAYRYSLHLLPRSMLVEVGSDTSTVEEAKNAMYPLASIIMKVLAQ